MTPFLLLALLAPIPSLPIASGDTVRVALTPAVASGTFAFARVLVGSGVRFPDVPEEIPSAFPAGFAPTDTFHVDLQDEVALVQSVRNGFTDDAAFRTTMARWGLDEAGWTPMLTATPDQAALIVVGRDAEGRRVALVDADNDETLRGETPIPFPDFATGDEAEAYAASLPAVAVRYERVTPGTGIVRDATTWLRLNVYPAPGRGPAAPGTPLTLRLTPCHQAEATFTLGGQPFRVAAGSTARLGTSFYAGTAEFLFGTDALAPATGPEPAYRVGDDVVLGDGAYRIAGLDDAAEALVLIRQGPPEAAVAPRAGRLAPPVAGVAVDGTAVDLAALRGQTVVLDFWGTWCTPCLAALPEMIRLHADARAAGVAFIGVAADAPASAADFARARGVAWPQLAGADSDRIAARYGVTVYPSVLGVGPDGRVVFRASGSAAGPESLRDALVAALGPDAGL